MACTQEDSMSWLTALFGASERVQPVAVDDQNFSREVLQSDIPVLLDVWSDGCAPCKKLEPIIFDLARQYQGRIKVAEVHVDRAPRTLARLGVRGTPTVIYFKGGREHERVVGFKGGLFHSQLIDHELLEGAQATA